MKVELKSKQAGSIDITKVIPKGEFVVAKHIGEVTDGDISTKIFEVVEVGSGVESFVVGDWVLANDMFSGKMLDSEYVLAYKESFSAVLLHDEKNQ